MAIIAEANKTIEQIAETNTESEARNSSQGLKRNAGSRFITTLNSIEGLLKGKRTFAQLVITKNEDIIKTKMLEVGKRLQRLAS
jgi:hypothetical protein